MELSKIFKICPKNQKNLDKIAKNLQQSMENLNIF